MHKRRLTRREKRSKNKKVVIISTICLMFAIVTGYAAFQTNLSITAKGNIKEKSRVIQAWDANSQTDFHSDFYKQNIVNATFLDNADVPSNAVESWNVSEDKEHGGVMAWVVPNNDDSTKYDLYIGANDGVIANEDSSYLFYRFTGLTSINFNDNFDTSNAINMEYMFSFYDFSLKVAYENNLTSINFGTKWNTENVTNMNFMFGNCTNLQTIDLSQFNTSNVTSMQGMFYLNTSLTSIDISKFNTSNVTNMQWMFRDCLSLTSIDVSSFNTSNVTNMIGMFQHNVNLVSIDLFEFNPSKQATIAYMFYACEKLRNLNLCAFNTNNVTNMNYMFTFTWAISNIYVGPNWTTDQAYTTDMFTNSGVSSVTTGQC